MNEDNLIPNSARTPKEREDIARKGGIASGESRRRRKQLREDLMAMLDEEIEIKDKDGQPMKKRVQECVANKLVTAAMSGDLKAIEQVAKLMGEYEQKIKLDGTLVTPQIVVQDTETAEALAQILKPNNE